MLHEELGQCAIGFPQVDGSVRFSGIAERVQNQTEMPSSTKSVAYTPPPGLVRSVTQQFVQRGHLGHTGIVEVLPIGILAGTVGAPSHPSSNITHNTVHSEHGSGEPSKVWPSLWPKRWISTHFSGIICPEMSGFAAGLQPSPSVCKVMTLVWSRLTPSITSYRYQRISEMQCQKICHRRRKTIGNLCLAHDSFQLSPRKDLTISPPSGQSGSPLGNLQPDSQSACAAMGRAEGDVQGGKGVGNNNKNTH